MPEPPGAGLGRILIYTRDIEDMVAFYVRHFGYQARKIEGDPIIALKPTGAGMQILLHPVAKSQKMGQVLIKLVFDVADVPAFCAAAARNGLSFGKIHDGAGYQFANAKDPSGNSVSVSSRAFRA